MTREARLMIIATPKLGGRREDNRVWVVISVSPEHFVNGWSALEDIGRPYEQYMMTPAEAFCVLARLEDQVPSLRVAYVLSLEEDLPKQECVLPTPAKR